MSFSKKFCSKSPFKHGDGSWGGKTGVHGNPANAEIIAAQEAINDQINEANSNKDYDLVDSLYVKKRALAAKLVKE